MPRSFSLGSRQGISNAGRWREVVWRLYNWEPDLLRKPSSYREASALLFISEMREGLV